MADRERRIGVLGLGTIGRAVAWALAQGLSGSILVGATSRDRARGEVFLESLAGEPPYLELDELIARADLIVEAATQGALVDLSTSAYLRDLAAPLRVGT